MALGLLAQKKGMTQFYVDGNPISVTVLQAGPCAVVQCKTEEVDGYHALQLGFGETKVNRVTKARQGHCAKAKTPLYRHLREFKPAKVMDLAAGHVLTVTHFAKGDIVNVQGTAKGRGFQGVIKRCGKSGGPAAHGSHFHRSTGSIGMRTWPGRVLKNTGMPGQMGNWTHSVLKLEVIAIDEAQNLLFVKGSVPGGRNALVVVTNPGNEFEGRVVAAAKNSAVQEQAQA